jgi:hypothetical protein
MDITSAPPNPHHKLSKNYVLIQLYLIALQRQQNSSFSIFNTNAELSKCVGEAKALFVSACGFFSIYDINSIYSFVHSRQYSMCIS